MTRTLSAVWVALLVPLAVDGQTLPEWVNDRVDEAVAARLAQRGSGRQVEAPSQSPGSTTLVDGASFADVAGLALNVLPTAGAEVAGSDVSTTAITLTPYALLSALTGADPDNPFHYARHEMWRSVALTLGREEEKGAAGTRTAALVGAKFRVWSRQNVDPSSALVESFRSQLGATTQVFNPLYNEVRDSLFAWMGPQVGLSRIDFINRISNDATALPLYLNAAGPEREAVLLQIIADGVDPFVRLRSAANAVVEELRGAPQVAIDVRAKIRDGGADEVHLGAVWDWGLTRRATWTLNASGVVRGREGDEATSGGASLATGLRFDFGDDYMTGADPIALDLAFQGQAMNGHGPIFRLQAKLSVPVMEGLSLPISATWSSRSELADEDDAVGRISLAVDTSRLLAGLRGG